MLEGFLFFSGCDCWEDLEEQGLRKEDPGIIKMEPPRGFLASLWNFICFLPYFIGLLILGLIKGLYSFLTVFNCVFFFVSLMVNCSLKFLFWVIFVSISQSSIFCALNFSCQIRKFLFFFRGSVGVGWLN